MSKIDDTIHYLKNDAARSLRKGYEHATVPKEELGTLLAWAEKVRENNPFLIGDRVRLEVDPGADEPEEEPKEGVVVAFGGPRAVLVDSGKYKALWYPFDSIERIED